MLNDVFNTKAQDAKDPKAGPEFKPTEADFEGTAEAGADSAREALVPEAADERGRSAEQLADAFILRHSAREEQEMAAWDLNNDSDEG